MSKNKYSKIINGIAASICIPMSVYGGENKILPTENEGIENINAPYSPDSNNNEVTDINQWVEPNTSILSKDDEKQKSIIHTGENEKSSNIPLVSGEQQEQNGISSLKKKNGEVVPPTSVKSNALYFLQKRASQYQNQKRETNGENGTTWGAVKSKNLENEKEGFVDINAIQSQSPLVNLSERNAQYMEASLKTIDVPGDGNCGIYSALMGSGKIRADNFSHNHEGNLIATNDQKAVAQKLRDQAAEKCLDEASSFFSNRDQLEKDLTHIVNSTTTDETLSSASEFKKLNDQVNGGKKKDFLRACKSYLRLKKPHREIAPEDFKYIAQVLKKNVAVYIDLGNADINHVECYDQNGKKQEDMSVKDFYESTSLIRIQLKDDHYQLRQSEAEIAERIKQEKKLAIERSKKLKGELAKYDKKRKDLDLIEWEKDLKLRKEEHEKKRMIARASKDEARKLQLEEMGMSHDEIEKTLQAFEDDRKGLDELIKENLLNNFPRLSDNQANVQQEIKDDEGDDFSLLSSVNSNGRDEIVDQEPNIQDEINPDHLRSIPKFDNSLAQKLENAGHKKEEIDSLMKAFADNPQELEAALAEEERRNAGQAVSLMQASVPQVGNNVSDFSILNSHHASNVIHNDNQEWNRIESHIEDEENEKEVVKLQLKYLGYTDGKISEALSNFATEEGKNEINRLLEIGFKGAQNQNSRPSIQSEASKEDNYRLLDSNEEDEKEQLDDNGNQLSTGASKLSDNSFELLREENPESDVTKQELKESLLSFGLNEEEINSLLDDPELNLEDLKSALHNQINHDEKSASLKLAAKEQLIEIGYSEQEAENVLSEIDLTTEAGTSEFEKLITQARNSEHKQILSEQEISDKLENSEANLIAQNEDEIKSNDNVYSQETAVLLEKQAKAYDACIINSNIPPIETSFENINKEDFERDWAGNSYKVMYNFFYEFANGQKLLEEKITDFSSSEARDKAKDDIYLLCTLTYFLRREIEKCDTAGVTTERCLNNMLKNISTCQLGSSNQKSLELMDCITGITRRHDEASARIILPALVHIANHCDSGRRQSVEQILQLYRPGHMTMSTALDILFQRFINTVCLELFVTSRCYQLNNLIYNDEYSISTSDAVNFKSNEEEVMYQKGIYYDLQQEADGNFYGLPPVDGSVARSLCHFIHQHPTYAMYVGIKAGLKIIQPRTATARYVFEKFYTLKQALEDLVSNSSERSAISEMYGKVSFLDTKKRDNEEVKDMPCFHWLDEENRKKNMLNLFKFAADLEWFCRSNLKSCVEIDGCETDIFQPNPIMLEVLKKANFDMNDPELNKGDIHQQTDLKYNKAKVLIAQMLLQKGYLSKANNDNSISKSKFNLDQKISFAPEAKENIPLSAELMGYWDTYLNLSDLNEKVCTFKKQHPDAYRDAIKKVEPLATQTEYYVTKVDDANSYLGLLKQDIGPEDAYAIVTAQQRDGDIPVIDYL